MPAFINSTGAAVEVFPGVPFVDRDDIQRPGNWLELAAPDERAAAAITDIVEPPEAQEGKVVAVTGLAVQGGKVVRTYTVEDAPPVVPRPMPDISDRQFGRGLWGDGLIDYADFLGFIGPGTIPKPIQAVVDTLPDDDTGKPTPRKDAVGFLTGSKLYEFSHPLVEAFRSAMEARDPTWTLAHLRDRWLAWSAL